MPAASSQFLVNLSIKGHDKLKRELASLGPAGEKALRQLERSTLKPNAALKALDTASRRVGQSLQGLAYNAGPAGEALAAMGKGGLAAAAGIGAVVLAGRGFLRVAEQVTEMENRLRLVTESSQELEATQRALTDIALKYGGDLSSLVQLYSRAALASKDLGASQQQLRDFTEAVSLSLQISGTNAQSASGALLQLSQAIGSGTVRAEEFNSILEGAPRLAQAAAQGIDGMGGSVAKLRQAVIDGQVSSEDFFNAILSQLPQLQGEFAQTEETAGRALSRINTATAKLVDAIDDATGASSGWADVLNTLASGIDSAADALRSMPPAIVEITKAILSQLVPLNTYIQAYKALENISANIGRKNYQDIDLSAPQSASRAKAEQFGPFPFVGPAAPPGDVIGLSGSSLVNPYTAAFGASDIFGDKRIPAPSTRPDNVEARRAIDKLDRASDNLARSAGALNAPTPRARPSIEERYTAGGGTFGTAPAFDFSRPAPFALADPNRSFDISDDMIARLKEGQEAYDRLQESNSAYEAAALNTAGILSSAFADYFTELLTGGEATVEGLMKELSRLITRMLIALAIQRALGAAFGAFGGGSAAAAGQPASAGTFGSYGGATAVGVRQYHSGGIVGQGGGPMRYVHPAAFADAPRYHSGGMVGLRSGEVPIIAQAGETVLPRGQSATPIVNVSVKNYSQAQVQTQQTSNGLEIQIRDMIENTVASGMTRPGSRINRAMRSANQPTKR